MSEPSKTFITDKSVQGHWRATLNNPPINVIDDGMYDAFYDLVAEIETDTTLKIVTFESAHPDFFLAHYGASGQKSRFGVPRWIVRVAVRSAPTLAARISPGAEVGG